MAIQYKTASDVRRNLRDMVTGYGSQKALAKAIGVSPAYLSDVIFGRRDPGPAIAKFLCLEIVTLFKDSE